MFLQEQKWLLKLEMFTRVVFKLKNSNRAIVEIAFECGFNSQSHLGKHFREITGMTPSNYRNS
jgi:AraC family transcriptional regulator